MTSVRLVPSGFDVRDVGCVTLICGDMFQVLERYPDGFFDACDSSPPFYNEDFGCAGDEEYYSRLDRVVELLGRKVQDYSLLFNSTTRLLDIIRRYQNITRVLAWFKKRGQSPYKWEEILVFASPRARYNFNRACFADGYPDYCEFLSTPKNSPDSPDGRHDYENPVELHEKYLLNILTFRDAAKFTRHIVDPFCGSGSVGKAALNLGLRCTLIEKDREVFEKTHQALLEWKTAPLNPKTARRISSSLSQTRLSEIAST